MTRAESVSVRLIPGHPVWATNKLNFQGPNKTQIAHETQPKNTRNKRGHRKNKRRTETNKTRTHTHNRKVTHRSQSTPTTIAEGLKDRTTEKQQQPQRPERREEQNKEKNERRKHTDEKRGIQNTEISESNG